MENIKIFLDVDEEISFIAEKILKSESDHIILIIPEGALILSSLAGLKLLNYIIQKSFKKVVLVTMDPAGAILSNKAGFVTKGRVGEVEHSIWSTIVERDESINSEDLSLETKEFENTSDMETETLEEESSSISKDEDQLNEESFSVQEVAVDREDNIERKVKPKYVESVKIIKLDGFDLVVGGDAAVIKSADELGKKRIAKKTDLVDTLHKENSEKGIIGSDLEVNVSKKKIKIFNNLNNIVMLTKENLKIITDKSPIKIKKWMLIPIGIAILLLIGFSIFFFPSANVEVKMTSREINKTFDVKANSQNTSVNVMRNIIPATLLDVTDSSSSSISTTGKKDFGNNATGTVVVYNSTTTTINIPAGTTFITSDSNAHAFTSQEAISVPGSSSAPQSQTVNLKAANFGSQYNVAISTPFKIKLDSIPNQGIITSASTPFQGGTSDVAQIVTQQDQDNLLKSLTEQLTRKETDALSAKITDEVHVVKDSLKSEVITKQFDKGVGDRETLLNLLLGIKVSQIAYKDSDIKTYTEKFLTKDLRKDETLKNVKFSSTINSFDGATGDVNITIKATGSAIPSLDSSTIANNIKMKSFSSSKSYIKTFNGVTDVTINVTPFWYNIFQFMPFKNNNISINVITK